MNQLSTIPPAGVVANGRDWRSQCRHSPCGADGLRAVCAGDPLLPERLRVIERYPFRVTPYYLGVASALADPGPLMRQFIPAPGELAGDDAYLADPFSERRTGPTPGLVHRYPDRVVYLATSQCAVRCRHCTRKNTLWNLGDPERRLAEAAAYVRRSPQVREVIVSGGDPLLLETEALDQILTVFAGIEHVQTLRIGSRVPVVLPMRIDDTLCRMLGRHGPLWVNTHFNHPAELTAEAATACGRLVHAGIPVSNQAVLLRGVNDSLAVMKALCLALQRALVRPYYVFVCDPVRGTAPFRTDLKTACAMEETLRREVGGLALPRFVADLPDSGGKTPVGDLVRVV